MAELYRAGGLPAVACDSRRMTCPPPPSGPAVRRIVVPLALALALVATGCSGQLDGRREEGGTPQVTSTAPPSSPATTATPFPVVTTAEVCESLDRAAGALTLGSALAIGTNEPGPALQAGVATAYRDFARSVSVTALTAPAHMTPVLTDWASAATEVATFVVDYEPRPDMVLEFGPAHPRFEAAQAEAENICGHPLPKR